MKVSAVPLLVLAAACGPAAPEPPSVRAIVLLSLDTLRADRMSLYGYGRATTPRLEELAARATVYTRAQAAAPWTLPSHASMFTGLYPYEHGARTWPLPPREGSGGGRPLNNAGALGESYRTLAEALREAGYATAGVCANVSFLDAKYGLAQGFDHWESRGGAVDEVVERALAWLDENRARPFFLFVNTMDTHWPYNTRPREGFPAVKGRGLLKRLKPQVLGGDPPPSTEDLARLGEAYDTAVANLDAGLGRLFEQLEARGLLDDALVVITADHGEYLGEHDLIEHAKDVHQEVLHVPLIVKLPGQREGRRDDGWISHVHLPELVLEGAGLTERVRWDVPAREREPVLAENWGARLLELDEPWVARLDRVRRALHVGPYKYVHSSDGAHELYDLAADPRETTNLVGARPALARELAQRLAAWDAALRAGPLDHLVEMDAEHEAVLRALGYAGGDDE